MVPDLALTNYLVVSRSNTGTQPPFIELHSVLLSVSSTTYLKITQALTATELKVQKLSELKDSVVFPIHLASPKIFPE